MKSHFTGPPIPLRNETVGDLLALAAANSPDVPAVVSRHQEVRISYGELGATVDRIAAGLHELGLRPGDRVGIWATNCVEWIYVQYAAARLGLVLVNVNPDYRSHDLRHILVRSRMKALFLRESDERVNYTDVLAVARSGQPISLVHTIVFGSEMWQHLVCAAARRANVQVNADDVVNIQYTSGTTGFPKGAMLSHRNVVNNAHIIARELRITPEDRLCAPVPLYHCFGYVISSLLAVAAGIPLVLSAARFDTSATMRAIHEERCTVLHGVPTMFLAYLTHPDLPKYDLTSLRTGIVAGAPCPIHLMNRIIRELPCPGATMAYGQTESSPAITMSAADEPERMRTETAGRTLPATEVRIIDTQGSTVETDEIGEICTRGYLVMCGYDDEKEATADAIDPEGWLHTGDLATMSPDGHIRIVGRLKDVVIRGGENIYPSEVEEHLQSHPDIDQTCVFGLGDDRLGEILAAWIRVQPGSDINAEDVREFCRTKIARFKIPHHIRFVDSFPTTPTGKIQRFAVRELEIEMSAPARNAPRSL